MVLDPALGGEAEGFSRRLVRRQIGQEADCTGGLLVRRQIGASRSAKAGEGNKSRAGRCSRPIESALMGSNQRMW